jgi:RNA polymerase-binding transcription factor DksA
MDLLAQRRRLETDLSETEHTLATIRARLAVGQRDGGGEISLLDQHPADAASDTEARELDVTQQRMLEARLGRIQAALDRIDQGAYGTCSVCGKAIPAERLEALPDTPYCVADAEREERK